MDAYQRAVSLLGRRERTAAALRAALLSKGHPEEEVDAALERVRELGYLDDARVAQARARRELPEGRSRADVARRLVAHGVGADVAEQAAEDAAHELGHDDEAAARALIARRRLTGVKAARLLASRGFDEALIRRVTGLEEES
jgi:regulatory protein